MSHSLNTCTVRLSRGEDHPRCVPIPILCVSAGTATESSLGQRQLVLGSRGTGAARHRRVGGRNDHHLSSGPLGTFDQGSFRRTDCSIGSLAGHRGASEELRAEVLDGNQVVVDHDTVRPLEGIMATAALHLRVQLGGAPLGVEVATGRPMPSRRAATSHLPLGSGQRLCGTLAVLGVRKVVIGVRGGSHSRHTPVDADTPAVGGRQWFDVAPHDEARPPASGGVPVDPHGGRLGGQLSMPHDRDRRHLRHHQPVVTDREAAGRVCDRRQRPLHGLEVLGPRGEVPQHGLLGILRSGPQPLVLSPPLGQASTGAAFPVLLAFQCLVVDPADAVPLGEEARLRLPSRPQPVGVAHRFLAHHVIVPRGSDMYMGERCRPSLPTAEAGGISGGFPR